MRKIIVAAALLAALASCQNNKAEEPASTADIPCICGTPEATFEGCPNPLCVSGEGNPDNPDCLCDTLDFEEAAE